MKKEITVSAKSVEEAVAKAVEELGAPSADKIEYTVIEEAKKGFLGIGGTLAKINASYDEAGAGKAAAVYRYMEPCPCPQGSQTRLTEFSQIFCIACVQDAL